MTDRVATGIRPAEKEVLSNRIGLCPYTDGSNPCYLDCPSWCSVQKVAYENARREHERRFS